MLTKNSANSIPLKTTPDNIPVLEFLDYNGIKLALRHRSAGDKAKTKRPLMFLSGYRSDMEGTKAQAIDAWAEAHGFSATRFDYSGHGQSGGDFYQGTISLWLKQSLAIYEKFYHNSSVQPILIGSSMGGWIALRMAQELKKRNIPLSGLILLAPAPDFTETLIKPILTATQRQDLAEKGFFTVVEHEFETPYSRVLLEDGVNNIIMNNQLPKLGCPIHIIHGMQDDIVPYKYTMQLMNYLSMENTTLTLVKDGDHRLSRSQDIILLQKILETFYSPL